MTTALAEDRITATFAALADPTRRALLARLATRDATVNELAEPFSLTLQAVSKHLKVLERAGLISRGRKAQFRPCHLEPAGFASATGWLEQQQTVWAQRYDKLDDHLRDLQAEAPTPPGLTAPSPSSGRAAGRRPPSARARG